MRFGPQGNANEEVVRASRMAFAAGEFAGTAMTAGYTPGVPRLGIPALLTSDASTGITNPGYRSDDKGATALPASIVVGSSFNPELARAGWTLKVWPSLSFDGPG
jgi:beta-glucosidase-like glycosyl hydrolase